MGGFAGLTVERLLPIIVPETRARCERMVIQKKQRTEVEEGGQKYDWCF